MSEVQLEKGEINVKAVVTIVLGIIAFVAWFYNSVIIPINNMQVQLAQIQSNILEEKDTYKALVIKVDKLENAFSIHLQQK